MSHLSEFARLLGVRHLGMLAAYCDESGKHDGSVHFVLSGLRANTDTWKRLSKAWIRSLDRLGISHFHAADCESGHGAFKGLSRNQRDNIQRSLVDVANEFNFLAVSLSIPRALHGMAVAPLNPKGAKRYKSSPYFFLFQGLISQLMDNPHGAMRKSRVAFFFDRQDEYRGTAERVYEHMRREVDYEHAARMGPLVFSGKSDPESIPLQLADMVAYESYKLLVNPKRPRWQGRALLDSLFHKNLFVLKSWDEEGIERLHASHREVVD